MATIIKRQGKKGLSYKIQVAVKDVGLGKMVTKSTTWKPKLGMTEKEIETECIVYADKFEKQVIEAFKTAENDKGNLNITFRELSEKWIQKSIKTYSDSYEGNARQCLEKVLPLIGGYKIKDITPSIVQSVFDRIDKMKKTVYEIYPKPNLKAILAKEGIDFIWLRKHTELNEATLSRVYNGKNIGIRFANMFIEVCQMDMRRLFDVKVKQEQYSGSTLKRFKVVIYNVLSYAVKLCLIEKNYASSDFVEISKVQKEPIKCMNEEELVKFYSALRNVDNIKWRVSVLTILMTGMRRGELCGLNWDDIDFEKGKIFIQRSYTECSRKGMKLKAPKTKNSTRSIAIPEILINELQIYKSWYEDERKKWGDLWIDTNSVFTQRTGERIHPANIKQWVDKTCKLAGIPHYSVHSLRHTNITLQIMAGVPLVTVAGRAGHSRTSTTTDIYAYYVQSSDKEAAQTLNNIFSEVEM